MTAVALRNLAARKLRTALMALAVVLGVMMVSGTYVLTDTIERAFDDIFTQSNEGIDAVISAREVVDTDTDPRPAFPASVLKRVRETEGVGQAAGGIFDEQVAILDKDGDAVGGNGAPTFGASVLPSRFDALEYPQGRKPRTDGEVVIDEHSAERAGYELGDRVRVAGKDTARSYRLVGVATLGDVSSFGGSSIALFTLPEARRVARKQGQFDQISVAASPAVSPAELKRNLAASLPRSVEVETGEENTDSQKEDVGEFLGFLTTALLVFSGVSLFVASFLIFNTFSITVAQRTREFSMLRTIGATRRQLVASVMLEALVIGFAASVIGLAAGLGFAPAVNSLFEALDISLPSGDPVLATRTIVVALVLGTMLTVLASLVPALRITRVPPVAGLREGAVMETPQTSRLRAAIGAAVALVGAALMLLGLFGALSPGEAWVGAGAAAIFVGVALVSPRLVRPLASVVGRPLERLRGVPGRLARENATRNPGRTAATAGALMVGLALVSFVTIFAAGLRGSIDEAFDKTVKGDLILTHSDGFSDFAAGVVDEVRRVDGVAVASPSRFTEANAAGEEGSHLTLVEPSTAAAVQTLDWKEGDDSTLRGLGPTDAVLNDGWAKDRGLEPGDRFRARTATGKTLTYTVRGLFRDRADFSGDYVASDVNAAAYGERDTVTQVLAGVERGADVDAVKARIDDALEARFPTVDSKDQSEFKDFVGGQVNELLGAIYALLLLSVIVSLFGIVNTLALSIHERTRELGLVRAVGMSRRQVRRVVRYEAVITALIGAVLGSVLGVAFAAIMSLPLADEGFQLSVPVGNLVLLLVLAALAGVVAAIGPARRASRLDVLDALAYE